MKHLRKVMTLVLAALCALAVATPAWAGSKITPTTGDGSIKVTNSTTSVSLDGRTFRAYKLLDVKSATTGQDGEYDKVAYTVPAEMVPFFTSNTATGLNLNLTGISTTAPSAALDSAVTKALSAMDDDSAAIIAFAEKALAWCKENADYYEATGAATGATDVTFSNLPLGYYLVQDTTVPTAGDDDAVSAVILDTTTPKQTIVVKASTVPSDKSITGINTGEQGETNVTSRQLYQKDTDGQAKVSDVSVGDIVHFQVDSKVPDTRGYNYYKFVVNDTLDKGLKLDKSTIKVTVDGAEYTVANGGIEVTTDPATPTGEAATTLKIVLKDALAKFTAANVAVGDDIAITYDAELIDKAPVGQAVENKVTIDYTNNPNVDVDKTSDDFKNTDPKGTTPEVKTKTYTTEITILKVDENGSPLANAEFTLTGKSAHKTVVKQQVFSEATSFAASDVKYWKLKDGSYTTQDPETVGEGGQPKYDLTKYADYKDGDDLTAAASYKKYKLNDTTAITDDENSDQKVVVKTDDNGVVTFSGLSEGNYTITETQVPTGYNGIDPINVTITFAYDETNGGTFTCSTNNLTADGDNTFSTTIVNNSGTELPSTGGMGTTILYTVGGILIAAGGIWLVTKKRLSAME